MESGIATLDNKNDNHETITHAATLRQKAFELRSTTDDHCMALVGLAHDKQGKHYIIAKNSWGTIGRYHGYILSLIHIFNTINTIAADRNMTLGMKNNLPYFIKTEAEAQIASFSVIINANIANGIRIYNEPTIDLSLIHI